MVHSICGCVLPLTRAISEHTRGALWRCAIQIDVYFALLYFTLKFWLQRYWHHRAIQTERQTDTQTTLHVTSVAIGHIYAMHAIWPKIGKVQRLGPEGSSSVVGDTLITQCSVV